MRVRRDEDRFAPGVKAGAVLPVRLVRTRNDEGARSCLTCDPSLPSASAPLFALAAGRHGSAYLGYTKVAGTHSGRVVVVHSKNGGRRWGRPRTAARPPAQALEPAVAVAGDGTVGVTWYDFRNDKPGDGPLTTDYWFAY
jgi:hypothetical protein